jgi:L-asparaginase II
VTSQEIIVCDGDGVYAGIIERAGLAFALKVRDGHMRASKAALAYLVDQHSGFSEQEKLKLQSYLHPQVLTWGQNKVGQVNIQTN